MGLGQRQLCLAIPPLVVRPRAGCAVLQAALHVGAIQVNRGEEVEAELVIEGVAGGEGVGGEDEVAGEARGGGVCVFDVQGGGGEAGRAEVVQELVAARGGLEA